MYFPNRFRFVTGCFLAVALLGLSISLAPLPVHAQDAPKPPDSSPQSPSSPALPVIKTESRIVLVDSVVTDKKGNYIHDLTQQDFKVFEDNKEQPITSFSIGSDTANPLNGDQKRYLVFFFDNSSMDVPNQMRARDTAAKFIEQNPSADHYIAVAEYTGSLVIKQNFTTNVALLKSAVSGVKVPYLESNGPNSSQAALNASTSPIFPGGLSQAEADLGARSMLLSIRTLAKNLRSVPGRKMLILFSSGFPLDPEGMSELTATIDACNKANVAIYSLDVRGLMAPTPTGKTGTSLKTQQRSSQFAQVHPPTQEARPRLVLASYPSASAYPDPQKPGGGGGGGHPGGGGGGGGHPGGGGGTGGGGGKPPGGGKGGGTSNPPANYNSSYYNNSVLLPRSIVPQFSTSLADNQQVLQALAQGTGGFTIYNTNDLLGGLNRIAREQGEFYLLGYVPQTSAEGACHTIKVKLNHAGAEVRSRSGYCNVRPSDPLGGKPVEKQMEVQATNSQPGSIAGAIQVPYFYTGPNVARINVAMDIPGDSLAFNKEKGKYHSNVNVLGIAYKPDGTVGARFSDTLDLDLEKEEWKDLTKQAYHYQNQFDAAPGSYKLTIVFTAGGEHFGKFETRLEVAPYDGKKITLGGVVLTTNLQRIDQISSQVDSTLVEDRTPLIVKGLQVTPAAKYLFKKSDNVVLYSELYAPILKSPAPPAVGAGYIIYDKATNKEVFSSGGVLLDDYVQKGNSVVPFGLKLHINDLPPGNYHLVLQGMDGLNNRAPAKETDFTVTD